MVLMELKAGGTAVRAECRRRRRSQRPRHAAACCKPKAEWLIGRVKAGAAGRETLWPDGSQK